MTSAGREPTQLSEAVAAELRRSGYSREGFAALYDGHRPRPPAVLLELLPFVANVERFGRVVDLGCGTGLSTRFWASSAAEVVGVEPNDEMRAHAEASTDAPNVRYVGAASEATGLDDGCADLVTCSQSLQWMEPETTLAEIARILRPGGVLAAYEYRFWTLGNRELEDAFSHVLREVSRLRRELGLDEGRRCWPPSREQLEQGGHFRSVGEMVVHSVEQVDAERLVGFALSMGTLSTLLAHVSEQAVGLDRLRDVARQAMSEPSRWYLGYRLFLGFA